MDKPAGWTSHDVVVAARAALGTAKIGHAGTLDPFATGLLVLGVGQATRILEYLTALEKKYDATALLGVATDTLDPEGRRVREDEEWKGLAFQHISEVAAGMTGPLRQTPPVYSAVKVRGVSAHRRVRRGEKVTLAARTVTVHALEIRKAELPEVRFRVRCSSGTYVRSLAEELGKRLGTASHLTALRRTRIGGFHVERASSAASLREHGGPEQAWVSAASALSHLERVQVDPNEAAMLSTGKRIRTSARDGDPVACVLPPGRLVAVGEVRGGVLKPRKVFRRA